MDKEARIAEIERQIANKQAAMDEIMDRAAELAEMGIHDMDESDQWNILDKEVTELKKELAKIKED